MTLSTSFEMAVTSLQQAIAQKRWERVLIQLELQLNIIQHLRLTGRLTDSWHEAINSFTELCLTAIPEIDRKAASQPFTMMLQNWLDVIGTWPGLNDSVQVKLVEVTLALSPEHYRPLPERWPSRDELIKQKDTVQASLHKVVRSEAFSVRRHGLVPYLDTLMPYYQVLFKQQSEQLRLAMPAILRLLDWLMAEQLDDKSWAHLLRFYFVLRNSELAKADSITDRALQLQWQAKELAETNQAIFIKQQRKQMANPGSEVREIDTELVVDEARLASFLQPSALPVANEIPSMPLALHHHREKLAAARATYQETLAKANVSYEVLAAQQAFGEVSLSLLNQLLIDSIALLGEPPCRIALLALGSSSRLDRLPYSDVELALVYEPKPGQEGFSKNYIAYLLRILELKIICLGETPPTNESPIQGFYLDSSSPLLAGKLWGTVDDVFTQVVQQSLVKHPLGEPEADYTLDHSLYSMLQPRLINTVYQGEDLFNAYRANVETLLKTIPEQAAVLQIQTPAIPVIPYQQYLGFYVWQSILTEVVNSQPLEFNVKDRLHKPLVYFALALKLYLGLKESYPAEVFYQAAQQGFIDSGLAKLCRELLAFSIQLRSQLHNQHKTQLERLDLARLTKEQQQRLTFFQETLLPLWQEALIVFWQQRQAKIELSFTDCIGQVFKDWLSQADKLAANFSRITQYLLYIQADLATHRYYYRQLPTAVQPMVLAQLKPTLHAWSDKALWPEEIFIEQLWQVPDEAGNRASYAEALLAWQQTLAEWTTTAEPSSIQVYSPIVGMSHLKSEKIKQLMEQGWVTSNGQFVKKAQHKLAKTMAGNHLVIPLPDSQQPTLYLKVFPEYPLMELFLNDLQRRLGNTAIREVDLWYWQSGKQDYPVLVSQAVHGEPLPKRLQANAVLNLDKTSFSAQIITAALVNLEDAKPDNFIVVESPTGAKLVAIDNDRWFVPAFQGDKLNAKNILFCFDEMEAVIEPVVREELLNLNPKTLLAEWLAHLKNWGDVYQGIFGKRLQAFYQPSGLFNKALTECSMILPPLPPYAIQELFNNLQKLQDLLARNPQATHWHILGCISPRLANHYQRAQQQQTSPLARFEAAAGQAYQRNPQGGEYLTTKIDFKTHATLLWTQQPNKFELIQTWQRDMAIAQSQLETLDTDAKHIQAALQQLQQGNLERFKRLSLVPQQQLLKELNWSSLNSLQQRELLSYLKTQTSYKKLVFKNSAELSDVDVRQLMTNSAGLKSLTLHACPAITFEGLKLLSSCQQLKRVVLSQLPALTGLGYLNDIGFVLIPSGLEQLTLRDCSRLEYISLKANALRKLRLSNCPILCQVKTQSMVLEQLTLQKCSKLTLERLAEVAVQFEKLTAFTSDRVEPVYQLLQVFPTMLQFNSNELTHLSLLAEKIVNQLGAQLNLECFINMKQKDIVIKHMEQLVTVPLSRQAILTKALHGENESVRSQVATSLGELSQVTPEVIAALIKALGDKEWLVRCSAAQSLSELGQATPDVVAALVRVLGDKKWFVRYDAAVSLAALDQATPDVVAILVMALGSDELGIFRYRAAESLGKVGQTSPEIIAALVRALGDEESAVRKSAAASLVKLSRTNPQVLATLIQALGNELLDIRIQIVKSLGQLGQTNPEVIAALTQALSDMSSNVRTQAAESLVMLGQTNPEVITTLIQALSNELPDIRRQSAESLGQLGQVNPEVIAALIKALGDKYWLGRKQAAESLVKLSQTNPEVITTLIQTLGNNKSSDVRLQAAICLVKLGQANPEVIAVLIEALGNEDSDVRMQVAESLSQLGHANPQVIAALIQALGDEDSNVCYHATESLVKLGQTNPEVITTLIHALSNKDSNVRITTAIALAKFNDQWLTYVCNEFKQIIEQAQLKTSVYLARHSLFAANQVNTSIDKLETKREHKPVQAGRKL